MAAAPPAQFLKDQEPIGFHGPPPPRYDEAMAQGHRMPYVPQPAAAPYPPHNVGMVPGVVLAQVHYVTPVPPPSTNVTVNFGSSAATMRCPRCNMNIIPMAEEEPHICAHVSCLVMFLLGFWLCCFFPYCMDSCKNVIHKCPHCRRSL